MGKYSHSRLIGGAASCALLLGTLTFPATVASQMSTGTPNDGGVAAPARPQPGQYGTQGYGMPPGNPASEGTYGFSGHMSPPPGYHGPGGYGYGQGMSPFDKGGKSAQPQGYGGGFSGGGGAPMPAPSMHKAPDHGMMDPGKAPDTMPRMGQGGMHCSMGGSPGCAMHKPFMRRGGMGMGAGFRQLFQLPNLTDEQRRKIQDISDELRRSHWKSMGEKMEHSAALRRLYEADPLDAKAIGATYAKIFDIKRKMIETDIEANQKAKDVLTDEQRKQLRSWRR
uniref:Protein refolding chaperone Spy/CpxP family n=1 Tax=Candidatus Kentrum sp. LFY TaxID=2126342 RepID=A0A450UZZ8_9GAMM|nr:MAG: protein refolding chaperone Spy/CpxP family [Candidatus Kentron sp. LFY]